MAIIDFFVLKFHPEYKLGRVGGRRLPGFLFPVPKHHGVLLALGREEGRLLPAGQHVHEGGKGWVLHLAHHRQGQWALQREAAA